MVQSFQEIPDHDIAFYAGLLVAVFTFCEFLGGMVWAKASDRIGRKPTLLMGALCGIISALFLGMSRSVATAIASRAFGGFFNPNVSLVQTCTAEIAKKEQQGTYSRSFTLQNNHGLSLTRSSKSFFVCELHQVSRVSSLAPASTRA